MGKKQKKSSQGAGDDPATTKHEQPLQAVLLADSFTHNFRPLSLDRPKVLSPLNNVTMLDYAIDFLAGAGVEEVFVVCVSDRVETYIEEQSQGTSRNMSLQVVKDPSLTNAGDALRELDKQNLVQSDPFILMFGDAITNVDLSGALVTHQERHKKDSSAMMTMLMKEVGAAHFESSTLSYAPVRKSMDDLVVGVDPSQDNRILVYDDRPEEKSVSVPCSFFASHSGVELRYDLLDCGIDICSPDVLARFSDEFDYRDIRREFVTNSVAEEEEGLQNKIFCHFLKSNEYAARVHDFNTYAAVSRDLLRRWCYPVVPDNLPSGYEHKYCYKLQRQYLYQEQLIGSQRVGRSSVIKGAGMVGSSCVIGEDCRVEGTVIGDSCHIASKATVKGCHLWNNVEIGEGATVIQSILADGVVVKAGAIVNRGCIIGEGCVIGVDVVLPECTLVTLEEEEEDDFGDDWDEDEGDEEEESETEADTKDVAARASDTHVVGKDGKGQVWRPPLDDDPDIAPEQVVMAQSVGFDPSSLYVERFRAQEELEDDFSDEEDPMMDEFVSEGADTVTFEADATPRQQIIGRQKGVDVVKELKIICLEYESTSPIENLAIELNSFKFSQNASYSDCTMAATLAILEKMDINKSMSDGKLVGDFKLALDHWAPLLQKMTLGIDEEKAIIGALEMTALGDDEAGEVLSSGTSFRLLLQSLYNQDLVSEEAVLGWAVDRSKEDEESPAAKLVRMQPVQDFLEWLQEESDEESDDDEDEEDDEE